MKVKMERLCAKEDDPRKYLYSPFCMQLDVFDSGSRNYKIATDRKKLFARQGGFRETPQATERAKEAIQSIFDEMPRHSDTHFYIKRSVVDKWAEPALWDRKCPECFGLVETIKCEKCDGCGEMICMCPKCSTAHEVKCQICHGAGVIGCAYCAGEKRLPIKPRLGSISGVIVNRELVAEVLTQTSDKNITIMVKGERNPIFFSGEGWYGAVMPMHSSLKSSEIPELNLQGD